MLSIRVNLNFNLFSSLCWFINFYQSVWVWKWQIAGIFLFCYDFPQFLILPLWRVFFNVKVSVDSFIGHEIVILINHVPLDIQILTSVPMLITDHSGVTDHLIRAIMRVPKTPSEYRVHVFYNERHKISKLRLNQGINFRPRLLF